MMNAFLVAILFCFVFYAGSLFAKSRIIANLTKQRKLSAKEIIEVMKIWT